MPSLSAFFTGIDHLFERGGALSSTFLLEVDGLAIGRFSSVSGLKMEVSVETYAEGGRMAMSINFLGESRGTIWCSGAASPTTTISLTGLR